MEPTDILPLLDAFPVISLNEMETVRLMDRTDTKFLTTLQRLPDILRQMGKHYRIQYNGNDQAFEQLQQQDQLLLNQLSLLLHLNQKVGTEIQVTTLGTTTFLLV